VSYGSIALVPLSASSRVAEASFACPYKVIQNSR
jgi:hypothetical protein